MSSQMLKIVSKNKTKQEHFAVHSIVSVAGLRLPSYLLFWL